MQKKCVKEIFLIRDEFERRFGEHDATKSYDAIKLGEVVKIIGSKENFLERVTCEIPSY